MVMIENAVTRQLGGTFSRRREPGGLCCTLTLPPELFEAVRASVPAFARASEGGALPGHDASRWEMRPTPPRSTRS